MSRVCHFYEENDKYNRIDNVINNKYKTQSILNKIYIHKRYLKCSGLYDVIRQKENDEEKCINMLTQLYWVIMYMFSKRLHIPNNWFNK